MLEIGGEQKKNCIAFISVMYIFTVSCSICQRYGCLLEEEWEGAGLVAFSCLGLRADTPCKPEITLQVRNPFQLSAVILLSKRPAFFHSNGITV
jgi:hypothetical protein